VPHAVTLNLPPGVVAERIAASVADAVRETGDGYTVLDPQHAFEAMRVIRDDPELDGKFLTQMCSVDRISRIDVVYHFSSLVKNHIFQVRVPADREQPEVPSITPLWAGARLQEREIYDMMGVYFAGHANLKRLFLWAEFPGHPLRKDFMGMPGGQKSGLSQFPKQAPGQTGNEFRPRLPGTGE
jgi:NADH-quinone oxidoreductase subunit C